MYRGLRRPRSCNAAVAHLSQQGINSLTA